VLKLYRTLSDIVDFISYGRMIAALVAAIQQTIKSLLDELTNLCNESLAS
jgi:uncharacterized alkaline shock family protein YloU